MGVLPEFMPTSRGFDEYYGIPYSVDMGKSVWSEGGPFPPLPLMENETVLEQPVDLSLLSEKYLQAATSFIETNAKANKPWLLYFPLSHVHVPDYMSQSYCNSSIRGFFGDALTELDNLVGGVLKSLTEYGVANNTLTFFTSDNGPWLTQKLAGGSAGLFRNGKQTTWLVSYSIYYILCICTLETFVVIYREGGVREPGFVHWPGMIDGNTISFEIVTTYDIFPTIINIANATEYLPNDGRIYDGKDMSDILFYNGKSKHNCIYYYKGGMPEPYSLNGNDCPYKSNDTINYPKCQGLWAVRCADYKAHWVTTNNNGTITVHNPPLLYNINMDPSELHPIYPNNNYYNSIIKQLNQSRIDHLNTLKLGITNQILLGTNNDNVWCMDPNSQQKYPNYPNCTGTPQNFNTSNAFVCQPVCLDFDVCGTKYPGNINRNNAFYIP